MRVIPALLFSSMILCHNCPVSVGGELPIYYCYGADNIFHLDVYQEKLVNIVAFVNKEFGANVTIAHEAEKELVSVRCEAKWLDVMNQLCASNNLEILKNETGWIVKRKSASDLLSQEIPDL